MSTESTTTREDAAATQSNPFKTIERGADGKYRWVYELNMFKNPAIVFTLWKVLFISFGLVFIFVSLISINTVWFSFAAWLDICKEFLLIWLGICVLTLLVYWVYGAIAFGGKYCVLFEMDDKGVVHRQLEKQFKKAQAIALLGVALGAAAGNLTVMGSNLMAATKSESSSEFRVVRSVKPHRWYNTIKVNEPFSKNQVYVPNEDFDAVLQYIVERCPNIKQNKNKAAEQ